MYREAPPSCLEIIGPVEVFTPRPEGWPPLRRLGRVWEAGRWHLVDVIDFGTARERYAADDTWDEAQAVAFLHLRADQGSSPFRRPLRCGSILPRQPGTTLPPGCFVPPGHLEALPRPFLAEARLDGTALLLRDDGPPLSADAAQGALAALGAGLAAISRWAMQHPRPVLGPGHLRLQLWLFPNGDVELRPCFRYLRSADYAFSKQDLTAERGLLPLMAALERWTGGRAGWAAALHRLCSAMDGEETSWPAWTAEPAPISALQRAALAAHAGQHLGREGGPGDLDALVLAAPPAHANVPRWRTASLMALAGRTTS